MTTNQYMQEWDRFYNQFINDVSDDPSQTPQERAVRKKRLEANPEEWFAYYFPSYCTCEPAPFHKKATKRLLKNRRWYEVRPWSRELAKSARSMFEVLYLALTGEVKNTLLVSNSSDNAERLLLPFMINLEKNRRIIADYGEQRQEGAWQSGEFTAKCGCSFRALGAGQSPRGTRNEASRPDFILIDDIDTDEECRNPDRIATKWKWIEEALFGTVSVSGDRRILFNGNIIAKDCCITRAIEKADHYEIVNIRDKDGKSTWAKNKEEDIDYTLSKISIFAQQKEYFNNPMSEGDVFKEVTFGACPALSKFKYLVAYADPATSNKDKKGSSLKALMLIGALNSVFYVIRGWLDNCSNDAFIDWFYDVKEYVGEKTQVYYYVENNSLQDPFYEQVFKPLFYKKSIEKKHQLSITGDTRKKPDKFARIEGNLEPLNRSGKLILNIAEKDNPHMQRLKEQFMAVTPTLKMAVDGVDAVEGGIYILNNKVQSLTTAAFIKRPLNKKRY